MVSSESQVAVQNKNFSQVTSPARSNSSSLSHNAKMVRKRSSRAYVDLDKANSKLSVRVDSVFSVCVSVENLTTVTKGEGNQAVIKAHSKRNLSYDPAVFK